MVSFGGAGVDKAELRDAMKQLDITVQPEELEHLFEVMDADGDGTLSYDELERRAHDPCPSLETLH